ncbi:SDR family oxidoreductase [Pendulispora rubella]|uniref:SDR family oxidoreductase n=1 Tax=Pendulispora rubella TaxID=2741070 RepID=A0ABZ2LED2_9BACT
MSRPGFDEVVLLTGFPSFGARKICEEILLSPKTLVHAVVRPQSMAEAMLSLDILPLEQRRRVNLLEGDAAAMDLGLSGKELRTLTQEVDRIHHAAEVSYIGVDRAIAEQTNVGGTREILEVAEACSQLKCLVFHSTAAVSGDRTGFVREEDLDKGQGFRNVVEETKARSERMMRQAMANLPIAVVRPAILVGDSQTGEVDRFDGPYLLILLMVTSPPDFAMPLPGRGDSPLHLVPIDYVAKVARAIGLDPRSVGRTFHVVDPRPLTARGIFELVARAGGRRLPRGFIPANLTKALLRTPGIDRFAKSPRAFLDALGTPVVYGTANTDEILAGTGIQCPPFETYVERLVEFVQVRLREKREKRLADRELEDPLG